MGVAISVGFRVGFRVGFSVGFRINLQTQMAYIWTELESNTLMVPVTLEWNALMASVSGMH